MMITLAHIRWLLESPSVIILFVILLLTIWLYRRRSSRQPENTLVLPGPKGLPILGSLLAIDATIPHISMTLLARCYGPAFALQMGSVYTVVLSQEKLIRQALGKEQISGRAPLYVTHGIMQGKGIICAEGQLWRDHRRFLLSWMKATGKMFFGPRKDSLEGHIQKCMLHCAKTISKAADAGKTVDISHAIHYALGDIMNQLVFGVSWPEDHPTWEYLVHLQEEGVKHMGVAGAVNFIPILRFLPSNRKTLKFLLDGKAKTHKIYDTIIRNHRLKIAIRDRETCDLESADFDFVHDPVFHQIVEKLKNKGNLSNSDSEYLSADCVLDFYLYEEKRKVDKEFSDECQLRHALADMWGAGVDTTAATLRWLIALLADNQEIQDKARSSIPKNRHISAKDRSEAVYLQACILEAQRMRSVVPLGIPHGALEDTVIGQYFIPKGSMVIPLQWALHMDPTLWNDPEIFNPERFLDDNNQLKLPGNFIPFQAGKRVCLGEEMARTLLFIGAATLLQNFKFSFPENYSEDYIEVILNGICGLTLVPGDHQLVVDRLNLLI